MPKFIGPLNPFRLDLVMPLAEASERSGRSVSTVRTWCARHHVGRKVGGEWAIDRVAFDLFLDGRNDALRRYLAGDRTDPEVIETFERLGVPFTPLSTRKGGAAGETAHASA